MIRFGTLGAARITPDALIRPCDNDARAVVSVVAARSRARAEKFARQHGIAKVVDTYTQVVNHECVDAVYIPLPITQHHEWAIKALRAGKHVLCEKPFAANACEAREMAQVAAESNRVLMDAFHYRYHPIFLRAREIYAAGQLGEISTLHAAFHVPIDDPSDIRLNYETGGGVTMDIGCYPISWVRHITNAEPLTISANAITGPADVDVYLTSKMQFPDNISVTTSGDMRPNTPFSAIIEVTGAQGRMRVNNPIAPHLGNSIELTLNGETHTERFTRRPSYSFQLDRFLDAVNAPANACQHLLTGPKDAVQQMSVIDRVYQAAGLPIRGLPKGSSLLA
jgi:predicted dehydrogenase